MCATHSNRYVCGSKPWNFFFYCKLPFEQRDTICHFTFVPRLLVSKRNEGGAICSVACHFTGHLVGQYWPLLGQVRNRFDECQELTLWAIIWLCKSTKHGDNNQCALTICRTEKPKECQNRIIITD